MTCMSPVLRSMPFLNRALVIVYTPACTTVCVGVLLATALGVGFVPSATSSQR